MLSIRNNHKFINSKYYRAITKNTCAYSTNHAGLLINRTSGIQRQCHTLCRQRKQQQKEFSAAINLLNRSIPSLFQASTTFSGFHTNVVLYKENDDNAKKSSESSDKKEEKNDDKPKDEKKKKDDGMTDKVVSLFTRTILWFGLGYALFFAAVTIRTLFAPRNRVEEEDKTLFVSWQEFVYDMLSVGEVKELIILPEMSIVTIILHNGAIIKGRRAPSRRYHILLADPLKFEERLREVEHKLGIKESKWFTMLFHLC